MTIDIHAEKRCHTHYRLPWGPRALSNFIYLSMLGIENVIGNGRRPSVEVLVETEASAMETLPSRWTYFRGDYAKNETNKNWDKKLGVIHEKVHLCSVCIPNCHIRDVWYNDTTAPRTGLPRTAGYNPCHGRSKCSAKTTPPQL